EECPPIRNVSASISVGPPPLRARATASRVAAITASRSFPSTRTPGKPYATALIAMLLEAVCFESGTEIAHWLFWQKNTTGIFITPAKFAAAWKSDEDDAPSPM